MDERPTFRELFDERDREEIIGALQARLGLTEGRINRIQQAERVTDAFAQLDRAEARREYLNDLIKRVMDESI